MTQRSKWLPWEPEKTYQRRYVDHYYQSNAETIRGVVLDVGAKSDERARWESLSDNITEYYSLDIERAPSLAIQGDATRLPVASESVDTVILSEVIEHIRTVDLADLASEVARVLRPGGTALVSTPFVYPMHGDADHSRLTRQAMRDLFESAGLKTSVSAGGAWGEVALSTLWKPLHGLLAKVEPRLGWLFALPHYALTLLAAVANALALSVAGRNPRSENWYLMTFTVAKKPD